MKNDLIKAYTVHLSTNCFGESDSRSFVAGESSDRIEKAYEPVIIKDAACFRNLVDLAKEQGMNTILVAVLDGLVYDSHPEIALPGAWTKGELKAELDHIRSLGMNPVPMLNFSAARDQWMGEYAKKVSTPEYYRLCEDLINELCELFGRPALFHLGMDEESEEIQKIYSYQVIRGETLLAKDLNFLFDCCRKNGARPWIFGDHYYNCYPASFEKAIPKDVLISASQITSVARLVNGQSPQRAVRAMMEIPPLGYDFIPMISAWGGSLVPGSLFSAIRNYIPPERIAGFWNFPALGCREENRFKLTFELLRFQHLLDDYEKEGSKK